MKLSELASALSARLLGDGELEVGRVRAVDEAEPGDLGFAAAPRELKAAFTTRATALLVGEGFAADHAHELPCALLVAEPPSRALVRAVEALHPEPPRVPGVHPRAVIDAGALLGRDVSVGPLAVVGKAVVGAGSAVGPLAVIGDDVHIGEACVIGPGAILLAGTRLGARVTVGPGTVVGDEGFVYAPDDLQSARNLVVRHVAGVVLGDDVEIGANACVDRGALRDTRVGQGTKIDNLAQIGHDVIVGEHAVIVAQVGIAGDARIGDGAVLAGQAGVGDRKIVGKNARVGGQAGVTRDIAEGAAVSGTPAIPHMLWLRSMARLKSLEGLERRVRALEEQRAAAPPGSAAPHPPASASGSPTGSEHVRKDEPR
jgi:UDP-3-O-[3-hydroxymyristoyl] glucosamine N-acyltransferase